MLKRNIAILIAGGVLGAQMNLAAAQSAFPMSAEDQLKPLPAQLKYLEERAASIQGVARGDSFPSSAEDQLKPLPAQLKYLEERAASIQAETRGGVYKTVKISASTKYVNAEHLGTMKFVDDKGQSFIWTFDTLGEVVFPLKTIAPAGFAAGETRVYVRHPVAHGSS